VLYQLFQEMAMKWLKAVAGESPTLEGTMADTAFRPAAATPGSAIRERLRGLDDSGVVSAFLDGESRAFDELVNRYQNRLLNFVYRTTGDRERAEDLVQEVFVRVYRHIHRFDRSRKFDLDLHDRVEPGEERVAQSVQESVGPVPDDPAELGG
jgi:hypothetical protein